MKTCSPTVTMCHLLCTQSVYSRPHSLLRTVQPTSVHAVHPPRFAALHAPAEVLLNTREVLMISKILLLDARRRLSVPPP